MSLTNYERETIITMNDEEKFATIYTCNKSMIEKLDKYCKEFPDIYRLIEQDEHSKTYTTPKKYVSIRKPKVLTEEQKEEMRNRFKARIKKSVESDQ